MTMPIADALPDADVIRRKAAEVLQREEYRADEIGDQGDGLFGMVMDALRWVMEQFNGLSQAMAAWPVPVQWAARIVAVLLLLLVVSHIVYTMLRTMRVPERAADAKPRGGRERDPRELERLAAQAHEQTDYIAAVRLLFRAAILRLENAERRVNRPGTTNRELLRRYRSTPVHTPLQQFVSVIDTKWYGGAECGPEDYESCRHAHDDVRNLARRAQTPESTSIARPGAVRPSAP